MVIPNYRPSFLPLSNAISIKHQVLQLEDDLYNDFYHIVNNNSPPKRNDLA